MQCNVLDVLVYFAVDATICIQLSLFQAVEQVNLVFTLI